MRHFTLNKDSYDSAHSGIGAFYLPVRSVSRRENMNATTTGVFRSDAKLKLDGIIKDCHSFCKDTVKCVGTSRIEEEAEE